MKWRDTLAVIADFATIVGVSIVSFITTPLVSTLVGRDYSVLDFVDGTLFYLIIVIVALVPAQLILKYGWNSFNQHKYWRVVVSALFFLLVAVIFIGTFSSAKDLWANLFNNEYFLPEQPSKLAEKLEVRFDANKREAIGRVIWRPEKRPVDPADYWIVTYTKYHGSASFKIHDFFVSIGERTVAETDVAEIGTDGSFVVPDIEATDYEHNLLEGLIVAVVTRLDNGAFRRRYPIEVFGKNATGLHQIGAFVREIECRQAGDSPLCE